jgi:hypothetical protein
VISSLGFILTAIQNPFLPIKSISKCKKIKGNFEAIVFASSDDEPPDYSLLNVF